MNSACSGLKFPSVMTMSIINLRIKMLMTLFVTFDMNKNMKGTIEETKSETQ